MPTLVDVDLSDLRGHPPPADDTLPALQDLKSVKSQKSHISMAKAVGTKMKFTERDLLRLVVESPQYLSKALG